MQASQCPFGAKVGADEKPLQVQMRTYVLSTILLHEIHFVKGVFEKKMQKDMPITSFLVNYAENDTIRGHMPGHKGKALPSPSLPPEAYAWDITEIEGADSLFEADGILRESERLTAELYGSADCCFSAGGSTLCIQAMLARMKAEHRHIIAARTVHRAFLNACVLLDLPVTWVYPRGGELISGEYALSDFEAALQGVNAPACIYVTSPDYCGTMQDIAGLSALCRRYGARLLVDNAHGAHLAFLPENRHPIHLGADFCCDSAHKMLPALTGAAMLHCREACGMEMKQYMQLFGSTSPSYLILQSIEGAIAYLREGGAERIRACAEHSRKLREKLTAYTFKGDDPLHLTVACDGVQLAADLRANGIECEYADRTCLVLLLSPVMDEGELARLESILAACKPLAPQTLPPLPKPGTQALPLREAALSAWETLPLQAAIGRICGPVQVPCPPAVPLFLPGERITEEGVAYAEAFGVGSVAVTMRNEIMNGEE